MVRPARFELTAFGSGGQRSIQLSYERAICVVMLCVPGCQGRRAAIFGPAAKRDEDAQRECARPCPWLQSHFFGGPLCPGPWCSPLKAPAPVFGVDPQNADARAALGRTGVAKHREKFAGAKDGTRTHGHLGHNQVLYQLSYFRRTGKHLYAASSPLASFFLRGYSGFCLEYRLCLLIIHARGRFAPITETAWTNWLSKAACPLRAA